MIQHLRSTYLASIVFSAMLLTSANKIYACTGHDVIFTNITFTAISSTQYTCSYQIKNIGTAGIALNDIVIQNYVSTDNMQGNDGAAGGSFIDNQSTAIIEAGATYDGVMGIYPFPNNSQNDYPYLISDVYLNSETECDLTNNQYIGLIQLTTTGIQSTHIADADVIWNADAKSFLVKNWSGNASSLEYSIYTLAGSAVHSGKATEGQSTPIGLMQNGLYLLYFSDGEKVYVKKIVY